MHPANLLIDLLSPDPKNARKHDGINIAAIKGSLEKFGQQKPIVVAQGIEGYTVIAGNGTLQAAKELGWKSIECVITDLSGSDAMAFALADNRTSELASWDDDVLTATLKALKEEEFPVEDIGFSDFFEEDKPKKEPKDKTKKECPHCGHEL